MTAIRGNWQHGRVVLDQTPSWAEGSRLVVVEADDAEAKVNEVEIVGLTQEEQGIPRIRSPRLVHPEQAVDFVKEVIEVTSDARV